MLVVACCISDVMCSHGWGIGFVADSSFFCDWFVVPVVVVVVIAVLGVTHGIFSRIWWDVLLPECSSWVGTLLVFEPISPFTTLWHGQISFNIGNVFLTMYSELFFVTADGWMSAGALFVSIPLCLTGGRPARGTHRPPDWFQPLSGMMAPRIVSVSEMDFFRVKAEFGQWNLGWFALLRRVQNE